MRILFIKKVVKNIFAGSIVALSILFITSGCEMDKESHTQERKTKVTIVGEQFYINGSPTYEGRTWTPSDGKEVLIEGLLMNARLVQGIFDDLNTKTRGQWAYPDTRRWDPDRNTREFNDAMATWREHGLLGIALNLQGGCPYGYCSEQRWDNSAFAPDGSLRSDYMNRLERVLNRADELGMVVILGYFYFGQDGNFENEEAVIQAVDNATEWLLEKKYTNVIIEINNECNVAYSETPILKCDRVHELIERAGNIERDGRSLYVSTSLGGGGVPPANIVDASDYVLLHGNGVENPSRITEMIRQVRAMDVYTPMPIVSNEDDQPWRVEEQGWGDEGNNFVVSARNYTSWGYFDFRLPEENEDYNLGYQSVPVNWHISSDRKRAFFDKLAEITGKPGTPELRMEWPGQIGAVTVHVEKGRSNAVIKSIDLMIDNEIVATASQEPYEFHIEQIPEDEHWVRARASYQNNGREIAIESPYYRNPWWPYGGRY